MTKGLYLYEDSEPRRLSALALGQYNVKGVPKNLSRNKSLHHIFKMTSLPVKVQPSVQVAQFITKFIIQ